MPEPYTPEQLRYLRFHMGMEPVGMSNPYHGHTTRSKPLDQFEYDENEARAAHAEQHALDVRFDDLYSEREQKLWSEAEYYRAKSERLSVEIALACKIMQSETLVESVRALVAERRELKAKLTENQLTTGGTPETLSLPSSSGATSGMSGVPPEN